MSEIAGRSTENINEFAGVSSSDQMPVPHSKMAQERKKCSQAPPELKTSLKGHHFWGRWKARFFTRSHLKELSISVSAYWTAYIVYLFAGQVVYPDFHATAMSNACRVIEFERSSGIFWEPSWQEWAISLAPPLAGQGGMTVFINWAYILSFAPLMGAISVTIYLTNRTAYRHYRRIFLLSYGLAIVVFIVFPVAPPRMFPEQFVDTIAVFGPSGYGTREMGRFYNAYAAMPSLHFGWTIVFGVFFLRLPNRLAKVCGGIYPALMLLAIIVTANHYIVDAVGGALLVVASFILVESPLWPRLRGLVRQSQTNHG